MVFLPVLIFALAAAQSQVPLSVTEPLFPPNAVGGATAVFAIQIGSGEVRDVSELYGQEPFSSSGREALSGWRFSAETSGTAVVVVCYRRPELFATGTTEQELSPSQPVRGLPFPKLVVEPIYPPDTTAQGSVVLRLEIAKDGSVRQVQAVRQLGILTQAGVEAVRRWRFTPARDKKGNAADSEAYAVLVFRTPLLVPARVNPGR